MKYKRNTYKNNHCKNTHTHRNRLAKQQINRATQTAEIRRLLVRSASGSPERLRYPSAVSYCVGALRGQVTLARDAGRRPISQSFGTLDTPRMGSWDHLTHREWGQDLERHIADMDARHPSSPDAGLRCILRSACPASRSKDSYPIHRRPVSTPVSSTARCRRMPPGPTCYTLLLSDVKIETGDITRLKQVYGRRC